MKKSMLALAIMTVVGSGAAMAASPNVQGGSSAGYVDATIPSDHPWFNSGNSGLKLDGSGYSIDLLDGPIRGSNAAIDEQGNGGYLQPKHVISWLPLSYPNIAQVWKAAESDSTSGSIDTHVAINSIRQITTLPLSLV